MSYELKKLIPDGSVLARAARHGDGVEIELASGAVLYGWPEGDCCSESWVEHLDVCGLGGEITGVRDVDMPDLDPSSDPRGQECLQVYQTVIETTNGEVIIEHRNGSNGYYGGYLNWSKRSS